MSGNLPDGVTDETIDRLRDEPPAQCRECDDVGCSACDGELVERADEDAMHRPWDRGGDHG
jgi:hypothetical protein